MVQVESERGFKEPFAGLAIVDLRQTDQQGGEPPVNIDETPLFIRSEAHSDWLKANRHLTPLF